MERFKHWEGNIETNKWEMTEINSFNQNNEEKINRTKCVWNGDDENTAGYNKLMKEYVT